MGGETCPGTVEQANGADAGSLQSQSMERMFFSLIQRGDRERGTKVRVDERKVSNHCNPHEDEGASEIHGMESASGKTMRHTRCGE